MVCKAAHGRMQAMVRLSTIECTPDKMAEEAIHEKITIQTIQREFHNANEANLLEEEDMYIFDSRPLTDPLHLVCCKACKKPIKASQFAAHAEHCKSSDSQENVNLVLDGTGHKKPPRKGRRHFQATNNGTAIFEQEKSESLNEEEVAGSELSLENQSGMLSSISGEAKSTEASVDHTAVRESLELCSGGTNISADVPVPLATKMYHSQGHNRLRIALSHLYHEASIKEPASELKAKSQ